MASLRRAFTLVELLVVLAIISIVAGILFPVFTMARGASEQAVCISNFRQVGQATNIYAADYDDYFVPVNHQPAETPNSRNDRTWVQLLLPYVRSFRLFMCPSDRSLRPRPEATFDQDVIPGDLYSQYYTASLRANVGYNFQYLSPILRIGGQWQAAPKQMTSVTFPSQTIMYVDSVWQREKGQPTGGGSWLVSPPCRYETVNGVRMDTFTVARSSGGQVQVLGEDVYTPVKGWEPQMESSPNAYGGAWPWHRDRMTVCRVDGSARGVTVNQLMEGCNVLPNWEGDIWNSQTYPWNAH